MKRLLLGLTLTWLALALLLGGRSNAQGVALDAQGWTVVTASPDTMRVYVDPAGNDANPGTITSPKQTIAAGMAALRSGKPDWLMLKSGAIFPKGFGRWTKSGRSASEPMVVDVYGGVERVKIRVPATDNGLFFNGGGNAPPKFEHVVFFGLDFEPVGRNGSESMKAVEILRPVENVLFENCRFAGFGVNLVFQGFDGPLRDIRLRRCLVLNSYCTSGHSQGLYTSQLTGLRVEETLFDHNGYGAPTGNSGTTIFNHNVYCQNGPASEASFFKACVFSDPSSHGIQLRAGGTIDGCLFTDCPIAVSIGGGNTPHPAGVPALVRGTVVVNGQNMHSGEGRGWGMVFSNISAARVSDSLVAHQDGSLPTGISLNGSEGSGIHNFTLARMTVHDWDAGIQQQGNITGLVQKDNSIQQPDAIYADPSMNIPPTLIQDLRGQSKANWDPKKWPLGGVNRAVMKGFERR